MKTVALTNSKSAHLPYPYDLGTPADRKVLAVLERAQWVLYCAKTASKP